MNAIYVADTGLFVAIGQPAYPHYRAVRSFAARNGITFVLPKHVYDELTVDDAPDPPPIDTAIEEGWAEIAAPTPHSPAWQPNPLGRVQHPMGTSTPLTSPPGEPSRPSLTERDTGT